MSRFPPSLGPCPHRIEFMTSFSYDAASPSPFPFNIEDVDALNLSLETEPQGPTTQHLLLFGEERTVFSDRDTFELSGLRGFLFPLDVFQV